MNIGALSTVKGDKTMTKEELKKWLPEITFWIEGGELYVYDPIDDIWDIKLAQTFRVDQIYVINDKHVEARKAFALDEPVEVQYRDNTWHEDIHPKWEWQQTFRPKPKVYEWQWHYIQHGICAFGITEHRTIDEAIEGHQKFEPSKRLRK